MSSEQERRALTLLIQVLLAENRRLRRRYILAKAHTASLKDSEATLRHLVDTIDMLWKAEMESKTLHIKFDKSSDERE